MKSLFRSILLVVFASISVLAVAENQHSNSHQSYFASAVKTLQESNLSQQQSNKAIVDANKVRKDIIALRTEIRNATGSKTQQALKISADRLVEKLKTLQAMGAELRSRSEVQRREALDLFEQGLVEKWGRHIRGRNPIAMGDSTTLFFAHNSKIRSVHPNMLNKMGTPSDELKDSEPSQTMSLLVPSLAAQNAPEELDIRSFQISREQQFFGHIEVRPAANDRLKTDQDPLLVPPNTIHQWQFMLSDLNGEPVRNATIEIVGHMPGHVHGLPTQPQVTRELSPGIYLVEGVKFQMKGWWVMQFNIESNFNKSDSILFNLVL